MSSPVTTVFEDTSIEHVAKIIAKRNLGSIVVTDSEEKPVGMITERDIVIRVNAQNLLPSNVRAKEVMTSPLRTIDWRADIKEAAKIMHRYDIRRLIVMDEDTMIGIISSKDVIAITPALIEIIMEKARITRVPLIKNASSAGYCDRCRQWSATLVRLEGQFICEECRIELEA